MILIIGGPCRTGKSTVARRLQEVLGVSPVPTDALVWMLQVAAPQLGVRHGTRSDKPGRLFPFLQPFVDAYTAAGETLVLEGDAISPDHVSVLAKDREVRASFLGHRRARPEHLTLDGGWATTHDSDQLNSLAQFVSVSSERAAEQCQQLGLAYFDVGEMGRAAALDAALQTLLQARCA